MEVNLTELLSVAAGFIAVASSIYAFSSKEKNLEIAIKIIDSKLAVFQVKTEEKMEMIDYKINGCYESLAHKTQRFQQDIKSLEKEINDIR